MKRTIFKNNSITSQNPKEAIKKKIEQGPVKEVHY